MKKFLLSSALALGAVLLIPVSVFAWDVTVDSITPSDGLTDISALVGSEEYPDDVNIAYTYTEDTGAQEYTMVLTVSDPDTELVDDPNFMMIGMDVSDFSRDVTNRQYTITFTTSEFIIPGDTTPSKEFVIAAGPVVANPTPENPMGGQGAPAAMAGGYVISNLQDFQISPPDEGEIGFGLAVTAYPTLDSTFVMCMPVQPEGTDNMLDLMGTMAERTVAYSDLAVYIDDAQVSAAVTETDDCVAYVELTFPMKNNRFNISSLTSTVTKTVMTKEKQVLSAAFKNARVKKAKKAKIFGWKKKKNKNKQVKIYKKKKGASKYKLFKKVRTNKNGYYKYQFTPKSTGLKKGTYYFKTKSLKKNSTKTTLKVY